MGVPQSGNHLSDQPEGRAEWVPTLPNHPDLCRKAIKSFQGAPKITEYGGTAELNPSRKGERRDGGVAVTRQGTGWKRRSRVTRDPAGLTCSTSLGRGDVLLTSALPEATGFDEKKKKGEGQQRDEEVQGRYCMPGFGTCCQDEAGPTGTRKRGVAHDSSRAYPLQGWRPRKTIVIDREVSFAQSELSGR